MSKTIKSDRIYLDYSATTPIDQRVVKSMSDFMMECFGNPSSIHSFGRDAKQVLEESREICRSYVNAESPSEIIFTSGGTESDNIAIRGLIAKMKTKVHVITSAVEHKAVLSTIEELEKKGIIEASYLKVDKYGQISIDSLKKEIKHNTVLISIMYANNEVGTIQPIREIGKYLEKINKERERAAFPKIYLHTDAVQAFAYLNVDVKHLHVDMMSVSAHKFCGPKGVGFLYVKKGVPIAPILTGGGQEYNKRPGTENMQSIVGMTKAIEILEKDQEKDSERIQKIRDKLIEKVLSIPDTKLSGHPKERLPGLASFIFGKIEGESILINLDLEGIAVSTGSACTSGTLSPSHVLTACGYSHVDAQGNIRFSLGRFTKDSDVKRIAEVLPGIVKRLRDMSPL